MLKSQVSKHAKDLIQKYASGLFRDTTLEFYGVKTAPIKELINVELPVVEVAGSSADIIFLLADNTYLHIEFQTKYNKADLTRFATYDIRLYERDGRKIITVIIYTADVKEADTAVNIGSLIYAPDKVMMYDYNGDSIYQGINAKIKSGHELTDTDVLNLIFLPLMRNTVPRKELAAKSIELAQTIHDINKRNACIVAAFAFTSKYLNEAERGELLEVIKVTEMLDKLIEFRLEVKQKNTLFDVAKKALKKGSTIEFIKEITGLDEPTIENLQVELQAE